MKSMKVSGILAGILAAAVAVCFVARAQAGPSSVPIHEQAVDLSLGERTIHDATLDVTCKTVKDYSGWLWGLDCEGAVLDAAGGVTLRGPLPIVTVFPELHIGGVTAPDNDDETEGKTVTCTAGQRTCGPGSKFHGACQEAMGGFGGSNPDPSSHVPQTWHCTVP